MESICNALKTGDLKLDTIITRDESWPDPCLVDEAITADGAIDSMTMYVDDSYMVLLFTRDLKLYAAYSLRTTASGERQREQWFYYEHSKFVSHVCLRVEGGEPDAPELSDRQNDFAQADEAGEKEEVMPEGGVCASTDRDAKKWLVVQLFERIMHNDDRSPFDDMVSAFADGRIERGESGNEVVSWSKVPWFTDGVSGPDNESLWTCVERDESRYLFIFRSRTISQQEASIHSAFLLDADRSKPVYRWFFFDAERMKLHVDLIRLRNEKHSKSH